MQDQNNSPFIPEFKPDVFYLSIVGGTMRQKVKEGTPGAVLRKYNVGTEEEPNMKEKWEVIYGGLNNVRLTGLDFETGEYGEQLKLHLAWIEMKLVLTISKKSRYFSDFAGQSPMLNLDQPFSIKPYSFKNEKDKTVSGFTITQNDQKIDKYAYFYEDRKSKNGLPDWDAIVGENGGEDERTLYYTQRDIFLKKFLLEQIVPKIPAVTVTEPTPSQQLQQTNEIAEAEMAEDDSLPF